jgi:hypothetical protein
MFIVQEKIYTYSEDFFMIAFFTLRARGVSTMVLIAGGEVTPAGGVVPATVMVTISVEVVGGSISIPWHLGSGGEADGLQKDSISMQQYRYLTVQQGSNFIPGGLDYMRFPLAHYPMTLRDQRQSFGQLHGWSGGVVPSRLPLGFLFHQGLPLSMVLCRAEPRLLELSSLWLRHWGEGGLVEGCRVVEGSSGTTLCVPAEDLQLVVAEQQNLFSTKSS